MNSFLRCGLSFLFMMTGTHLTDMLVEHFPTCHRVINHLNYCHRGLTPLIAISCPGQLLAFILCIFYHRA